MCIKHNDIDPELATAEAATEIVDLDELDTLRSSCHFTPNLLEWNERMVWVMWSNYGDFGPAAAFGTLINIGCLTILHSTSLTATNITHRNPSAIGTKLEMYTPPT